MVRFGSQPCKGALAMPRALWMLLVSAGLIPLASFMAIPFFPLLLRTHYTMGKVGILLGLNTLIQFGGSLAGGWIADRLGLKKTMVIALAIRTLGFLFLAAFSQHPWGMVLAILLIAIGAAGYLPANKALLIQQVTVDRKALFLSLSSTLLMLGMALGPLLAIPFLSGTVGYRGLFLIVSGLFFLLTLLHIKYIHHPLVTAAPPQIFSHSVERSPVLLVIAGLHMSAVCFFSFFQNYLGLYVTAVACAKVYSGLLALHCVVIGLLQPFCSAWIARKRYHHLIGLTLICFSGGYLLLSYQRLAALVTGTLLISMGEMILFLKTDLELTDRLSTAPALAFGIQRFLTGGGLSIGAVIGGVLYGYCEVRGQLPHFWLLLILQSFLLFPLLFLYRVTEQST